MFDRKFCKSLNWILLPDPAVDAAAVDGVVVDVLLPAGLLLVAENDQKLVLPRLQSYKKILYIDKNLQAGFGDSVTAVGAGV